MVEYIHFFKSSSNPCVILRVSPQGFEVFDVNKAYIELCLLSEEKMQGKDFFELFPSNPFSSADTWTDIFDTVLLQKTDINLGIHKFVPNLCSKTTFGDLKYYEIEHSPILNEQDEVEFILRKLKDVTQEFIQKELYSDSQKSIQYGNWWLNAEQNTMEWSTGFKDILEIPHDFQPNLENAKQFYVSEEEELSFYDTVDEAMANKTMIKTVISIVTATGKNRWLLLIGKPILVEDICVGMQGIAKDITEKLSYLAQIENQHNNLQDIAFTQSHLVRAPLARILALVQHLKNYSHEERLDISLLDALGSAANELDLIIHDIIKKTATKKPNLLIHKTY